jgi:ribose transport system substrate-binding protein
MNALWRRVTALGVCVAAVAVLFAVAAGGSSAAGNNTATAAAGTGCVPGPPSTLPKDPDGVAATLTGAAKAAMGGYPGTVYKSPWVNFKPKHGPPWKIGMSNNEANLNAADLLVGLKEAEKANPGKVSSIVSTTPATPNDVPAQIQQMRSLLQQHVDIIFSTLGSPTALNAVIEQAAKQNVPVISILGQATDKHAVNLQPNPIQLGYYGAAGLVKAMGSSGGNALVVQGIPGLSINTDILKGGLAVLKACHVNIVGTLTGSFDPTIAKTQVLTFLSSHPGTVNGVFQVADMAPGIFSAFAQVGRKVPPVADIGAPAASLAYWKENESKGYKGTAVAIPPTTGGEYTMDVGLAMLEGRGVKITDVPFAPPVVTAANLSQWVLPGWTTSTNALANGPAGNVPFAKLIDSYFSKP